MTPTAIVVRRPGPGRSSYPGPTVRSHLGPVAVVIGLPCGVHCRIPHVPVRHVVLPRTIPVEGAGIYSEVVWQVLRRLGANSSFTPLGRPAIECIEARGVE